jgi:phage gp29-like protein
MGLITRLSKLVKPDTQVILSQPIDQQQELVGGGVGPARLSSVFNTADTGDIRDLMSLGNEARQKDGHLQATLFTRECVLAGLDWTLTGEGAVQEFCKEAIINAIGLGGRSKGFIQCLSHLSSGVYYSFGVSEIDWQKDGHFLVPGGFFLTNHRRFEYNKNDGELDWRDPGMKAGVRLQDRYPGKFIQHQPRVTGDIPCREGLIRVLLWAYMFRNWGIGDFMKLAEMTWKPWRFGVYKGGASTEDITNLENVMRRLTSSGIATHSDRVDIKVEWPERGRGAKPEHLSLAEFLGSEMSKAVLGQTLTTEQGERGARSLGEVHDRVRKDIMENDAKQLSATLTRDLVAPLVRMNFGDSVEVPKFEFTTEEAPDMGSFMRGIESGARAGLKMPQQWVREKAGIRHPIEGEDVCEGQTGESISGNGSDSKDGDDDSEGSGDGGKPKDD